MDSPITKRPCVFICGVSRSGTTLLTTIMDSHPNISLGYELMPTGVDRPQVVLQMLRDAAATLAVEPDLLRLASILKKQGMKQEALLCKRVARAGVTLSEYTDLLSARHMNGAQEVATLRDRFELSIQIANIKADRCNTRYSGFKLNNAAFDLAEKYFPNALFLFILRDPRDVWVSQVKRQFDRTVVEVVDAWASYLVKFERFMSEHPSKAALLRYEDLVSSPEQALRSSLERFPIGYDDDLLAFSSSKASVHAAGHPNADSLSRGFFTTSVGSWDGSIADSDFQYINAKLFNSMARYGYE